MNSKRRLIAAAIALTCFIPFAARAGLTCNSGVSSATCTLDANAPGVYAPSMPAPSAVEYHLTAQANVQGAFGSATADITLSIDGTTCSQAVAQKLWYSKEFSVVTDCLVVVPRGAVFHPVAVSGNNQATANGVTISAQPVALIP